MSADDLIKIRKDNTAVRASKLLEPYVDKWMTVTNKLTEVELKPAVGDYKLRAILGSYQVRAYFREEWTDRLSTISLGSTVTVRGKVQSVHATLGVELSECELL